MIFPIEIKRIKFVALITSILLFFVVAALGITKQIKSKPVNKNTCDHCNILIIDVDILRADELPCYGYFRNTAPNICSFAKNSIVFKDNYSTSFWTLPSIFSTITSLYPTFHRMRTALVDHLSPNIPTMAEVLHKEGYTTAYVGWNNNSALLNQQNGGTRGYDLVTADPVEQVIANLSKTNKPWYIHYYLSDLHMPYLLPGNAKPMVKMTPPKELPIYVPDLNRLLNTYLKKHYSEVFLKRTIDRYRATIFSPDSSKGTPVADLFNSMRGNIDKEKEFLINGWKPVYDAYMGSFDKDNSSDVAYVRMLYDTRLNLLDEDLGGFLNKLDSEPLSKNTITMITSDHGEAFGEHGTFTHDYNYHTELFYTPLVIHTPQFLGKQIEWTSSNIDIFPTLIDLVNIKKPDGLVLQGHSLLPYIIGQNNNESFAIAESVGGQILINKKWLYYLPDTSSSFEKAELYNKVSDPLEKINVIDKNPELGRSLFKQIDVLRSYNGVFFKPEVLPTNNSVGLSPEKIKRLRVEGYF